MALYITEQCINCDVCVPTCPNDAIYPGENYFVIDPIKCTECVGHHEKSQCVEICPVNCILPDPHNIESQQQLEGKFLSLTQTSAINFEQGCSYVAEPMDG